jgi:ParB family chromosome partitioning protein
MNDEAPDVQMIPIEQINILNPRGRNKLTFQDIVANISNVGLKKPITVARRAQPLDGKIYDLVCGQGRLEAYIALGQSEIPGLIEAATREDCFLMSLIENLARRAQNPVELLREINNLKSRGYSPTEIAKKIDHAKSYVPGVIHLLEHGEERLLSAVERGRIPFPSQCRLPIPMRPEFSRRCVTHMRIRHSGARSC